MANLETGEDDVTVTVTVKGTGRGREVGKPTVEVRMSGIEGPTCIPCAAEVLF